MSSIVISKINEKVNRKKVTTSSLSYLSKTAIDLIIVLIRRFFELFTVWKSSKEQTVGGEINDTLSSNTKEEKSINTGNKNKVSNLTIQSDHVVSETNRREDNNGVSTTAAEASIIHSPIKRMILEIESRSVPSRENSPIRPKQNLTTPPKSSIPILSVATSPAVIKTNDSTTYTSPLNSMPSHSAAVVIDEDIHRTNSTTTTTSILSQHGSPRLESKFKHAFMEPTTHPEFHLQGVPSMEIAGDYNFIKCNHKYVVTSVQRGAGSFMAIPIANDCNRKFASNEPIIDGHTAPVTDYDFNPFYHDIVASASEDSTIKLWTLPDTGLVTTITSNSCSVCLNGHSRKVYTIKFHPTVSPLLLSVSADGTSRLWNVEYGKHISYTDRLLDQGYHDLIWNSTGSEYLVSSKDQSIKTIDTRTGGLVSTIIKAHEGLKSIRMVSLWDDQNRFITVGNQKGSIRQFKIWDPRMLSNEILVYDIDASAGTLLPYYDMDLGLLYLSGKGEGTIRYYDIPRDMSDIHVRIQGEFKNNIPMKGLTMLPKRGLNVMKNEIGRFIKLSAHQIEALSIIIPRQSNVYQADLYPDIRGDFQPHTYEQWLGGSDKVPEKLSMKPKKVERRASKGLNQLQEDIAALYNSTPARRNSFHGISQVELMGASAHIPTPLPATKSGLYSQSHDHEEDHVNNNNNNINNSGVSGISRMNRSMSMSSKDLLSAHQLQDDLRQSHESYTSLANSLANSRGGTTTVHSEYLNYTPEEIALQIELNKQLNIAQTRIRYLEFLLYRGGDKK